MTEGARRKTQTNRFVEEGRAPEHPSTPFACQSDGSGNGACICTGCGSRPPCGPPAPQKSTWNVATGIVLEKQPNEFQIQATNEELTAARTGKHLYPIVARIFCWFVSILFLCSDPFWQRCMRREGTSKAAPVAIRQAVGGGCQSGWGWLLSVTNAVEAGIWRQGDSAWA